jgi:Domain of unknown function (DUF1929)/Bacterial Ig-like domain (group 2)
MSILTATASSRHTCSLGSSREAGRQHDTCAFTPSFELNIATEFVEDSLMTSYFKRSWLMLLLATAFLSCSAMAQTLVSIAVAQVYDVKVSTLLPVYQTRQFTATGTYSDGSTQYLTQQVAWTSADTTIATVTANMGLVTATGVGTVNISASLDGVSGSSSLTTIASTLTGVVITPASWAMQSGKTQQFTATATLGANVTMDVTQSSTWASSNKAVATVSTTGLVTAVGAGTATITAVYTTRKGSDVITVSSTAPPNLGQWSAPQNLGITAIHMAMLNTGKVLTFSYPVGRNGGPTPARLFDPIAKTITDVTLPFPVDIFCSGLSFLYDGRLLVSGGLDDFHYPADSGIANTTFFDPKTNQWTAGPLMNLTRWYPTTSPMIDGTILSASGTANDGIHIQFQMETYNINTNSWTVLPASADMPQPNDTYPLLTLVPNGSLFYSAPRIKNLGGELYNPKTKTWTFVSNLNFGPRGHAATVLLPNSSQVMIAGGGSATNGNGAPTATTEIIDFSQPNPQWVYGPSMNIARYDQNMIYLADGTILAVGGNQNSEYQNPVFQPELYNPATQTWTLMAPQVGTRAYHSTAVLLPDGRVISSGSDSGIALENTYEIYSPPYMSAPSRPVITYSPKMIQYGKTFTVKTPQAATVSRVALIRPGSTTHAVHMDDQYYVDLKWTVTSGALTVSAPKLPNAAPPGYYMLVILDANGIPSVMPFIQLL